MQMDTRRWENDGLGRGHLAVTEQRRRRDSFGRGGCESHNDCLNTIEKHISQKSALLAPHDLNQ